APPCSPGSPGRDDSTCLEVHNARDRAPRPVPGAEAVVDPINDVPGDPMLNLHRGLAACLVIAAMAMLMPASGAHAQASPSPSLNARDAAAVTAVPAQAPGRGDDDHGEGAVASTVESHPY